MPQAWSSRAQVGVLQATGVVLPATEFGHGCSLNGSVGSALAVPVLVVFVGQQRQSTSS